ncbi:MAG: BlaI/MecI/CopY family transcriptional regulator, partial [Acidobacteriales bacterium]|nr:BlaI/MecI/CopY family transcriptional regulator [Terriglobales bacterium]
MKRLLELGNLEQCVMQSMWRLRRATVAQVVFDASVSRAYTTIMTTLERLCKKGLLQRARVGRSYVYEPLLEPQDLQTLKTRQFFEAAFHEQATSRPILSCFVDTVSERDAAALDELES